MSRATLRAEIAAALRTKRTALEGIRLAQAFVETATDAAKADASGALATALASSATKLPGYLDHGRGRGYENERVQSFTRGMLFVAAVTETEAALGAVARAVLWAFPPKIAKKQIAGDDVLALSPRERIARLVEEDLRSAFYGKPDDYWKRVAGLISLPETRLASERDAFIEAKATRDLGMHNEWSINSVYLSKAGSAARSGIGASSWDPGHLHPSKTYLDATLTSFASLLDGLALHCAGQFAGYGKARAFRDMWERSSLRHVAFERVWEFVDDDHLRRTDLTWAWSHTESFLFSFFERVFHGAPTTVSDVWVDRMQQRLSDTDMAIVWEWLVDPFYF